MFRTLVATPILVAMAATAQVTSYTTNNPAPVRGDADKIVCQKVEKIGTRLGAKKVCLTVSEWLKIANQNREQTERLQMGVCVPDAGCAPDAKGEPY